MSSNTPKKPDFLFTNLMAVTFNCYVLYVLVSFRICIKYEYGYHHQIAIVLKCMSTSLNRRNVNYDLAYAWNTEKDIAKNCTCNGTPKPQERVIAVINPDYKLQWHASTTNVHLHANLNFVLLHCQIWKKGGKQCIIHMLNFIVYPCSI